MGPVSILMALFFVGLFLYLCISLFNSDIQLPVALVILLLFGAITLGFVLLAYVCLDERSDTVTLTDNKIKFHLHRQTFPYSLKAIDDEVRWKDIQKATFVTKEKTTILVLTLISGEVKEFGIGHIDNHLKRAVESHFAPETLIEKEDVEQEEDKDFVPGRNCGLVQKESIPTAADIGFSGNFRHNTHCHGESAGSRFYPCLRRASLRICFPVSIPFVQFPAH